jgi:HEAT repeat protein
MPPPTDAAGQSAATGRRRAVALAGHSGDEGTAQRGLHDPAPVVRAAALGALARLGKLESGDVSRAMGDEDPLVRARAAEVAIGFGRAVLGLLTTALTDGDARVVEAACFALGELGGDASGGVGDLAEVAGGHSDPLCREAAVAALGAIGAPEGLAAILAATTDKPAVRRRAVLALAPFSGSDVDAALERALTDRDWQVRQAAEDLTGRAATS